VKIHDNAIDTEEGREWTEFYEFPSILEIRSDYDCQHYMGCLMQWSDVTEFEDNTDTVLSISPAGLRFQELSEYDDNAPAASLLPPSDMPVEEDDVGEGGDDGDGDDGDMVTIGKFFTLLLQEAETQEQKILVRNAYAEVLQQQDRLNRPITVDEVVNIVEQKQAEQAVDTLRDAVALARLQNFIEAERKRKAEEQMRIRGAQNALILLTLLGNS